MLGGGDVAGGREKETELDLVFGRLVLPNHLDGWAEVFAILDSDMNRLFCRSYHCKAKERE